MFLELQWFCRLFNDVWLSALRSKGREHKHHLTVMGHKKIGRSPDERVAHKNVTFLKVLSHSAIVVPGINVGKVQGHQGHLLGCLSGIHLIVLCDVAVRLQGCLGLFEISVVSLLESDSIMGSPSGGPLTMVKFVVGNTFF